MNYQDFSNKLHQHIRKIKIWQNKTCYCNLTALYLWKSYCETTSLTHEWWDRSNIINVYNKPEGVTFSYNTLLKRKTKKDELSLGCCSKGNFSLTAGPPLPPADPSFNCNTQTHQKVPPEARPSELCSCGSWCNQHAVRMRTVINYNYFLKFNVALCEHVRLFCRATSLYCCCTF